MSRDQNLTMLIDIPLQHPFDEEALVSMLNAEAALLSDGARIHDFIHVFAARRVRDKLLRQAATESSGRASRFGPH